VFTTYQSSHRLAAAAKAAKHTFDLGILDEAHKTVVERGGRYATLLHPKVAIRKRIAMTATERVLKGADDRVLSMDDPKVFGEVAFSYTFKAAIADGVICDYKVITLAVSESRMRELIASNKHLKLHGRGKEDRLRLAQDLAAGELLAKAQSEHGVRHAISFHRSIAAASGFADQWETVDRMVKRRVRSTAFHVSSKVPTGQRMELLRQFRESPSAVITNARCLTEGVDVPNVDAVLFADPRRSTVDIVQAVGRALRKSRDKPDKIGFVLLPVLVEDGQTVDEFLESSAFKEVGRVLAVLSTHDERIAEEFRAVEGGGTRNSRESRVVFGGDVPVGVQLSADEFAARCGARVWQRVARVNWRPFKEAREWVRGLGLGGHSDWLHYCAGRLAGKPPKPVDIPSSPGAVYNGKGWISLGDWLGTGATATFLRTYRPFNEARAWVHQLALRGESEWRDFCRGRLDNKPRKPSDIPSVPASVYRETGWISWGDWCGTGAVSHQLRTYRPFAEARAWVHGLGLRNGSEWKEFCAGRLAGKPPKPADIPTKPRATYKDEGWISLGDWLGTGVIAPQLRTYRPFAEARSWVRGLGLRSWAEWQDYCAGRLAGKPPKPVDIPNVPHRVYGEEGWIGFRDWLGTDWRPFAEARSWVRGLGLRSGEEWKDYCAGRLADKPPKPADIPNVPQGVYGEKGWISWGDWLGTDWRPFAEARAWARGLGLRGRREWLVYGAGRLVGKPPMPSDIPRDPAKVYRETGWISWGDWCGTGAVSHQLRTYRPFAEARAWVHGLGLRGVVEWKEFCAGRLAGKPPKPVDIPANPNGVYEDAGWIGFRDWLGTDWRPFAEARSWVRGLGLRSASEWKEFCAGRLAGKPPMPSDIPTTPASVYRDEGWISLGDWLGTGVIAPQLRTYRPFAEARAWVRGLGLRSQREWSDFRAGRLAGKPPKPVDIPANPYLVYEDQGWISWGDWFGTGAIAPQSRTYRPFAEARAWVHGLGLRNGSEWNEFCAGRRAGKPPKPADVPTTPARVYKGEGWIGFGDWLGTGTVAPSMRTYRPFAEARAWVRGLGLRGAVEWKDFCAGRLAGKPPKPSDIPSTPHAVFKNEGWIGWGDWFGTDRKPRKPKTKPT
jgi:hypothetical protein